MSSLGVSSDPPSLSRAEWQYKGAVGQYVAGGVGRSAGTARAVGAGRGRLGSCCCLRPANLVVAAVRRGGLNHVHHEPGVVSIRPLGSLGKHWEEVCKRGSVRKDIKKGFGANVASRRFSLCLRRHRLLNFEVQDKDHFSYFSAITSSSSC